MPKMKYVRAAALLLLAGIIGVHLGCGRGGGSDKDGDEETVVVPVEAATVTVGDIANFFTGTATLEAEKETGVVAKVGGVVARILVEEGDYVRADQVLAKLDDEMLAVQLEQAEANFKGLETEYNRSVELYSENLISDQDFQRTKYQFDSQKAAYDLSKLNLEYTSIRSPISGVVAERMIKVGNMVVPNQPVFRVTDLDPLLAVLHVPERMISELRVGQPAALGVDAIPGEEFSGKVERLSPVVDPTTGTVKVTVEVHDRSKQLKPGMFARINIVNDVHTAAVLAPRDAIIEEDEESSVFVVRDSTAYRQIVETGYVNSVHIEVLTGLTEGDTVVTTGKGSLKDSSRVELISPHHAEADVDSESTDSEVENTAEDPDLPEGSGDQAEKDGPDSEQDDTKDDEAGTTDDRADATDDEAGGSGD
jgi:membrane fusion protein (multidrug efflux system)